MIFFFFKQKTAYEMRISDWSSDVCSSDLLGSNYLVMFIGWEGVGLCSYLLIGFWFKNSSFASAGKKAFVMNRIGALSFLIAVLLIFIPFGTIEFAGVFHQAAGLASVSSMIVLISFIVRKCDLSGKSVYLRVRFSGWRILN